MRRTISTAVASAVVLQAAGCFFNPAGSLDTAEETGVETTAVTEPGQVTSSGAPASCGDGVVDDGEECDVGPKGNGACTDQCTLDVCGDGYVGDGEGCDDANDVLGDGCSPACTLESCGDGALQAGEACDDGNQNPTDACTTLCRKAACGDGFLYAGFETCDDGNSANDDECTAACEPARCGDGFVGPGEACDDGNDSDLDACQRDCTLSGCGDGVLQEELGEACDLGEDNSDEGACTLACVWAFCGDGLLQAGVEACDDGNMENDDGCLATCEAATCGDGFVGPREECDHGAKNGQGACNALCQREGYAVFVTSQQFAPGEDFESRDDADALCAVAGAALGIDAEWRAWLGDKRGDPAQEFTQSELRYVMFNKGVPVEVAKSWTDLVDGGGLLKAINLTELGNTVGGLLDCDQSVRVWTGMSPDGIISGWDCLDWTSSSVEHHGTIGSARSAALWTDSECLPTCNSKARLYCFEQ